MRHLPIRAKVTADRVRPPRHGGDNSPGARESDAIFVYPHATVLHLLSTPDGSNVTFFFQITVPGERGFEVRDVGKFVQGERQLLPASEQVVTGMKIGDEKRVELSAEEAFGPYDVSKKKTVPRGELPAETKEGDVLQDHSGKQATVTQMSDTAAVMDYNHPLAGKTLIVKIKILRVDNPS